MKPFKLLLIFSLVCSNVAFAADSCDALAPSVRSLLAAYTAKDTKRLDELLDKQSLLVLGSDIAEVMDSRAKVDELFRDDFALWKSAEFGEPSGMNCRVGVDLASAAFDALFTMRRPDGKSMQVTVRFMTVWRHVHGSGWRLTQSMNSTPTQGSSARELAAGLRPDR